MKNQDPTKPSKYITYLDENNLYDWRMSRYHPYRGYKWLKNVDNFDVNLISEKSPIGYILELDLEHPEELFELHNDYPLAPQKHVIPYDMLPDYCKNIVDEYGIRVGYVKKLIPNLGDKTNFIVHYKNLQLYVPLGMKLTKIQKDLKFKQSNSMKIYIDFNTKTEKMLPIILKKTFLN